MDGGSRCGIKHTGWTSGDEGYGEQEVRLGYQNNYSNRKVRLEYQNKYV